jgi:hypothetical protein
MHSSDGFSLSSIGPWPTKISVFLIVPISIVLGLAIGGMRMSSVGLVTGGMPVSIDQFGYMCDSYELMTLGFD